VAAGNEGEKEEEEEEEEVEEECLVTGRVGRGRGVMAILLCCETL
jgi:hypothetical protein